MKKRLEGIVAFFGQLRKRGNFVFTFPGLFWNFSLISGGIFMFIVFKNDPRDQTHEFEDSTVKLLYGVFTVCFVI